MFRSIQVGVDVVGLFCLDMGVALEKWGVLCSN